MTTRSLRNSRRLRAGVALVVVSLAAGACVHNDEVTTVGSVAPDDYRLRHPIAIQEANQSIDIFVGNSRGGLSASQRNEVMALAQTWLHEGTGAINADVPAGTPNARAAADTFREIRATLLAAGIPARGIVVRNYHPDNSRQLATIRLNYAKIAAVAGPCGLWPDDIGPSANNPGYYENKPYYNLGCANQRNLAAIVANPSDLVQPRPETPVYTARRTYAIDKYRQGQTTTTSYPETDKNKISNVGQ